MKPRVAILSGYGINCEYETAYCFNSCNSNAEIVHISKFLNKEKNLMDYQILAIPGGFSYGDYISSGKVLANKIKYNLPEIYDFIKQGNLIIGICNGFQVLVKSGILPNLEKNFKQEVTLTFNDSGKFEDRWCYLKVVSKKCVWTNGLENLFLPVRHGEGKFFCNKKTLEKLKNNDLIVLKYADENFNVTDKYPYNPNGSIDSIAGICDDSGRIFGLMPHPEAYNSIFNNPLWKYNKKYPIGIKIFENGVRFAEENLM